jgi:hypothetical protein
MNLIDDKELERQFDKFYKLIKEDLEKQKTDLTAQIEALKIAKPITLPLTPPDSPEIKPVKETPIIGKSEEELKKQKELEQLAKQAKELEEKQKKETEAKKKLEERSQQEQKEKEKKDKEKAEQEKNYL